MEVEMLVCDIGHGGNIKIHGLYSRLGEPMAGALDHGIATAGVHHLTKEPLDVRSVGCRDMQTRVTLAALDARAHGRNHAGSPSWRIGAGSGSGQDRLE
jgi:hypothetical protein